MSFSVCICRFIAKFDFSTSTFGCIDAVSHRQTTFKSRHAVAFVVSVNAGKINFWYSAFARVYRSQNLCLLFLKLFDSLNDFRASFINSFTLFIKFTTYYFWLVSGQIFWIVKRAKMLSFFSSWYWIISGYIICKNWRLRLASVFWFCRSF